MLLGPEFYGSVFSEGPQGFPKRISKSHYRGGVEIDFRNSGVIFFLALFLGKLEDPEINFKNELAG
jgi:hypothetical protein